MTDAVKEKVVTMDSTAFNSNPWAPDHSMEIPADAGANERSDKVSSGRKRRHHEEKESEEEEAGHAHDDKRIRDEPKDSRYGDGIEIPGEFPSGNNLQHIEVHRVSCGAHDGHGTAMYTDCPRLFKGDNKLTALRGRYTVFEDIFDDEFALQNPLVNFAVVKEYDCGRYYDNQIPRQAFRTVEMPASVAKKLIAFRYHLSILDNDGPEATPSTERIYPIARELKDTIQSLETSYPHSLDSSVQSWSVIPPPISLAGGNRHSTFTAPYLSIYHMRNSHKDQKQPRIYARGERKQHAKHLVDYVLGACAHEYKEADDQFAQGYVTKQHFPKLFALEDVIVQMTDRGPMGYVVSKFNFSLEDSVRMECWSLDHDGRFYKKRMTIQVSWQSKEEELAISSLKYFPLKFGDEALKSRLSTRGELFWQCRNRRVVECDSLTTNFEFQTVSQLICEEAAPMNSSGITLWRLKKKLRIRYLTQDTLADPSQTSNRYMVDIDTYKQMHREAIQGHEEIGIVQVDDEIMPEGNFAYVLPPTIRGYGFHDKKWSRCPQLMHKKVLNLLPGLIPIESIRDVTWNSDTFDRRLVLNYKKKELIKALIKVHNSPSNRPQKSDIIEGKGKGLIILLHGGPGTGKTLTAESIAEFTHCPLYRVTCGDIGTDPESVEKYLETVLYIGTVWRCVVLLDEADVFLEERTPTDLQRNALVSVFLRTLEYFEGILLLTSNRVGTFDEAFKSRVQLTIHYPPLDSRGRYSIWDMFFRDMLGSDERTNQDELQDQLNTLAQETMNGRQIRNVINTARQLAKYRGEVLAFPHIEQALDVAREFEQYVTATRGHTDEEFANAERIR